MTAISPLLPSQQRALVMAYLFGFPGVVNATSRQILKRHKYAFDMPVREQSTGRLVKHVSNLTKLGVDTAEDLLSDYVDQSRRKYPCVT